jgi:hypothetical protein
VNHVGGSGSTGELGLGGEGPIHYSLALAYADRLTSLYIVLVVQIRVLTLLGSLLMTLSASKTLFEAS